MFQPSKYQQAIFDAIAHGTGDIVVEAMAGAGKSSTIREAVTRLPRARRADCLVLAFNAQIAKEMEGKLQGTGATVKTNHAFGLAAVKAHFGIAPSNRNYVEKDKERELVRTWMETHPQLELDRKEKYDEERNVLALVHFLKVTLTDENNAESVWGMAGAYNLETGDTDVQQDRLLACARAVMQWSVYGLPRPRKGKRYGADECISFDDMIWLPARLELTTPTFGLVLVDESQDLNAAQLALALKAKGQTGRLCAVGDRRQAIYAFCGADARSFARIAEITHAQILPLSVCYRCPRSVVNEAKQIVPQIEAAPNAPEGVVSYLKEEQAWGILGREHGRGASRAATQTMVLCRTTAPLITAAFDLIARGVPATVRGTDIGARLVSLIDTLEKAPDFAFSRFLEACEVYRTLQTALLRQKSGENANLLIAALDDRVDSVQAVYHAALDRGARTTGDMRS